MDQSALVGLVNYGVLGIFAVLAVLALRQYQRRMDELQEKRVTDAQAVVKTLLEITDRQNEMAQELTETLSKNTAALVELRDALRDRRGPR